MPKDSKAPDSAETPPEPTQKERVRAIIKELRALCDAPLSAAGVDLNAVRYAISHLESA